MFGTSKTSEGRSATFGVQVFLSFDYYCFQRLFDCFSKKWFCRFFSCFFFKKKIFDVFFFFHRFFVSFFDLVFIAVLLIFSSFFCGLAFLFMFCFEVLYIRARK